MVTGNCGSDGNNSTRGSGGNYSNRSSYGSTGNCGRARGSTGNNGTRGSCATFDDDSILVSFTLCPNFLALKSYSIAKPGHILLPRNLSQLNDYVCGPLNRKGSECADGFGPSMTSFGYRCANCTDSWYGMPLFLFLEFVPITVFYLIILVFHISITPAPMPCFIMYAQIITTMLNLTSHGDGLARK